jgi:hypothetical protein
VATTRDYKAEYARRLANAFAKGLSRAQARGHARVGEGAKPPLSTADRNRLETALKEYRRSKSQTTAAKSAGVSPERFRRYLRENVEVSGRGKTLRIADSRPRQMIVISGGEADERMLRDFDNASINGRHLAAVRDFLTSNDIELLLPFKGKAVTDTSGQTFPLETDPNRLYRLAAAGSEVFHNVYRLTF